MKVEDKSFRIFPEEMKSIYTYTRFYVEEEFTKRGIVFKFKIGRQLLRFEDEFFLYEIGYYR